MHRLIAFPLLLSACVGIDGSGISATESRDPGTFSAVGNATSVNTEVTYSETVSVTVTCDDNLLEYIRTEVNGGELQVDTPRNTMLHPHVDCWVAITTPSLAALSGSGSGDTYAEGAFPDLVEVHNSGSGLVYASGGAFPIQSATSSGSGALQVSGIDSSCVSLDASGSGTLRAAGVADCADLDSSGSGGISAIDLSALDADIHNSGSGDVSLTVTNTASVDLSGSGDVLVAGGASVEIDDSGSGDVIQQ
jgi:Putative auto-transporter adhesin, head GIN domain